MEFLLALQELKNPVLDFIFTVFTTLGEQYVIMLIFCWLAWCSNKQFAHKVGFAFCFGMGINQVLKIIFCVQRPWVLNPKVTPSASAIEGATGYSFPSGHTQSGTTAFGYLALYFKKVVFRVLLIALFIMIGLSRIYFGVHTVWDVAASFFIGILVIIATEFLYSRCEKRELLATVLLTAISFGMVAFAILKPYPQYHIDEYMFDCIKIAGAIGGFAVGWFLERRFIAYKTDGSAARKITRATLGIALLLGIKLGFGLLPQESFVMMYVENFILIFWCIFLYPLIFTRFKK